MDDSTPRRDFLLTVTSVFTAIWWSWFRQLLIISPKDPTNPIDAKCQGKLNIYWMIFSSMVNNMSIFYVKGEGMKVEEQLKK